MKYLHTISRDVFPRTMESSTMQMAFPLNSDSIGESFRRIPFFLASWPGRMNVRKTEQKSAHDAHIAKIQATYHNGSLRRRLSRVGLGSLQE